MELIIERNVKNSKIQNSTDFSKIYLFQKDMMDMMDMMDIGFEH